MVSRNDRSIAPSATAPPPRGEQRFLLPGVRWETYCLLRDELDPRAVRLTYDGAHLELRTSSLRHERLSALLGRFVERLAEDRGLPLSSGGSTTFRQSELLRGLEPDRCYWLAHEPAVRGIAEFDPATMPPPDLAIEVEITRLLLDRLDIYHRLQVPEIWRCDGTMVECLLWQPGGGYRTAERSQSFPWLAPAQLAQFLVSDPQTTENELLRRFLEWSRRLG
jgi:Uma2 family endonuclease